VETSGFAVRHDKIDVRDAHLLGEHVQGDHGRIPAAPLEVRDVLLRALPVSLALGLTSLVLTFGLGVVVGLYQAARRGRWPDRLLTAVGITIFAAPSFWLALALVALFTAGEGPDPVLRGWMEDAARQLLLLQASDWAFAYTTGGAVDYAGRRIGDHAARFDELCNAADDLVAGREPAPAAIAARAACRARDDVFPDLDLEAWA